MGKFNKKDEGVKPTIVNHMGEKAYKPNAEEELVSTVMTTMLSDSYYEKEKDKVNRIKDLMDQVDPYFAAQTALYNKISIIISRRMNGGILRLFYLPLLKNRLL